MTQRITFCGAGLLAIALLAVGATGCITYTRAPSGSALSEDAENRQLTLERRLNEVTARLEKLEREFRAAQAAQANPATRADGKPAAVSQEQLQQLRDQINTMLAE